MDLEVLGAGAGDLLPFFFLFVSSLVVLFCFLVLRLVCL